MLGSLSKAPIAKITRTLSLIFTTCIAVNVAMPIASASTTDASASDTFATVRPSLALIIGRVTDGMTFGTAFCIASDDEHSILLTNKHVVESDKLSARVAIDGGTYDARVIARGTLADVALVEIDRPNMKALTLAPNLPKPGTLIAVAGYPSVHIHLDLQPSVHLGAVNSIVEKGTFIEHDALTDHGNSGGPVFDRSTGVVYGINTQVSTSGTDLHVENAFATSIPTVLEFIDAQHVSYTKDDGSRPHVAAASPQTNNAGNHGASRIGYLREWSGSTQDDIQTRVDAYVYDKFRAINPAMQLVPLDAHNSLELVTLCKAQSLTGVVIGGFGSSADNKHQPATLTGVALLDFYSCSGHHKYSGRGLEERAGNNTASLQNRREVTMLAIDHAMAQIQPSIQADPTLAATSF